MKSVEGQVNVRKPFIDFCIECDRPQTFSEDGYCNSCGRHADNVLREQHEDSI